MSVLNTLNEFIMSLDEYSFNKVEYQTASSGVCSETIVIINDTKIVLEKVGSEFGLSVNGTSGKINLEEYLDLYDRFAYANREMQDVLNSEFYESLES